ncbi:hypothetical protein [Phytohabitans aurantiacus]|uniref:Uncharacterized protein n=1 Tax=Phytohabitans aurantiacus TaxID=3016789 RepID=A0ABQ5R0B3_9ACTN|nr:hypothetical protein [Phytohabitans aurantiacus]GLI00249.1 hypothetical protein Pa4123_55250 [Phytohabitans aurantiacus]
MSPIGLPPPRREEVEERFLSLLDGRQSRDEVDRWAAQWVVDGDGVDDEHVWWALNLLYGVDLRHHPTGPHLHDDRQIQDWLGAFRQRCSGTS